MITNFNALADRLKGITFEGEEITAEKLIELHGSDTEIELGVSEGKFLTATQETELRENLVKTGYNDGKQAGQEMPFKYEVLKEKYGVDVTGKTLEGFAEAYKEKIIKEAGAEPTAKVKELQTSLELLQGKYQTDIQAKEENIKSLNGKISQIDIDNSIMRDLPKLEGIKPEHALLIAKQTYQFEKNENGGIVVKQNGNILKNDIESPVDHKEVLTNFAKENNWLGGSEGRGGENQHGQSNGSFKTMHDVMKHMENENIDPTGSQGLELINNFNDKA